MGSIFQIDTIIVDGKALDFEDSSGRIEGSSGYEFQVIPSASGEDTEIRKRVPRALHAKLNFNATTDPNIFPKMREIQIAMRDSVSGRKCIAPKCGFAKMGEVGAGAVEVTFNLLSPLQWL